MSLNLYTYCKGNPVIYSDPNGHEPILNDHLYENISEEEAALTASIGIGFTPLDIPKDIADFIAGKDTFNGEQMNRGILLACIFGPEIADQALRNGKRIVKSVTQTEKKVPNPFGKKGGVAHQSKIQDIADSFRNQGYDISFEKYVKTPGGTKSARYGDILVTDPKTGEQWIVQVGKQTNSGNLISREAQAIKDLESEGWKVEFVPYN